MRALILLIAIALFGAGYHLLTPDGRELIDRIAVNLTRADYQARFRAGEALPGGPLGRVRAEDGTGEPARHQAGGDVEDDRAGRDGPVAAVGLADPEP